MTNEPLVTVASITAIVGAVVALIVSFGVDLTTDQTAAILGLTTVLAPFIVALVVRSKVTPVSKQ